MMPMFQNNDAEAVLVALGVTIFAAGVFFTLGLAGMIAGFF